jgi:hypothetical protein
VGAVGRSVSEGACKEGEMDHVYVVGKYSKWSTSVTLKEAASLSSRLKSLTSSMHVAHAAPCSVPHPRINLAKCYGGTTTQCLPNAPSNQNQAVNRDNINP